MDLISLIWIILQSAIKFNPSYKIYVWYNNIDTTKWWERLRSEKICKFKNAQELIDDLKKKILNLKYLDCDKFVCKARLSDLIRFSALYKYGGIYLDTDTITLKSLDYLSGYDFWAGIQSNNLINIAIIGCISEHDIMKKSLERFITGGEWESILKILTNVVFSDNYKNIFLFKPSEIYKPSWTEWMKFFTESIIPDVPVLHYWNACSRHMTKHIDQGYNANNIIGNALKIVIK